MTRLRLGACLSLTGRYGRFGRQAAHGLMAWQRLAGDGRRVGDRGRRERSRAVRGAVRARGLALRPAAGAVLDAADARGRQRRWPRSTACCGTRAARGTTCRRCAPGGSCRCWRRRAATRVPFVRTLARSRSARAAVGGARPRALRSAGGGRRGRQAERRRAGGVEHRMGDGPLFDDVPAAWDLFSCGRVRGRRRDRRARRVRLERAAGDLLDRGRRAGVRVEVDDVDGMYGIAQWFPGERRRPELGPAEDEFVAAYREPGRDEPDYPAVQAAAGRVDRDALRRARRRHRCARRCGRRRRAGDDDAARRVSGSTPRRARRRSTCPCSCSGATARCSWRSTGSRARTSRSSRARACTA